MRYSRRQGRARRRARWVKRTALAFAVGMLTLPGAAMADWPVYGHDLSNTRNGGAEGPPATKVSSLSETWRFDSPTGDFTGTPVIAGGILVAGDNGGHVYALSAGDGKVLWERDLGAPINGSAAIDMNAPRGPAVFVPVARAGQPRVVALSLFDGSTRWVQLLSDQENSSVFASPTFWNGVVYIGTSGPNNDDSHARGSLVALNEANGQVRWRTFMVPPNADGAAVWSTAAIDTDTGRLYVGTGNNYHQPTTDLEDSIIAFDAATGRVIGHYQATSQDAFAADNPAGPDYDFGSSPNLFTSPKGQPLVGAGQKSGTYWALERSSLKPVWDTTVGPGGVLGGILGSTAFDGTRIYGADTLSGQVFALGRDGSEPWQSLDTPAAHLGPTMVANGVVWTVDEAGGLTARDPETGMILNKLSLGGPSFGGASAYRGAVYASVGTGPPPEPAPQQDGNGSIVAFGDTAHGG